MALEIDYSAETILLQGYERRLPPAPAGEVQCPDGYTENGDGYEYVEFVSFHFSKHGFESIPEEVSTAWTDFTLSESKKLSSPVPQP